MKKLFLATVSLLVIAAAGILFLALKHGDEEWEEMDYWRGH